MRWSQFPIVALLLLIAFTLGSGQLAHADDIGKHARELDNGNSYKVRLSAALWLAKKSDSRAIDALARALEKDAEAGVRQVAAKALLDLLTKRIPADVRSRAFAALQHAKSEDKDSTVRRRAKRALKKLANLRAATPTTGQTVATDGKPPSAVFVHVGKPTMGKHQTPKGTGLALTRAVSDQLRSKLSKSYFRFGLEDSELPTQAELQRDNVRGWYVGATISALKVTSKGNMAEISCTVSMRVNPWNGKDANQRLSSEDTASAEGSAKVQGSNNKREIGLSKRDCLIAVTEQITVNRVVPFLKQRNPTKKRPSASRKSKQVRVSRSRSAR